SCTLLGCVVGVAASGMVSDWLGRKKTLFMAGVLFLTSAVGTAMPEWVTISSLWSVYSGFVTFRILGGIGVGFASVVSPTYIAETTPTSVRGRMVSVYQLAITLGIMVVFFVNYFIGWIGTEEWNAVYGWRWMFGSETLPALGLIALAALVPESPRWLIAQGRSDEARDVLTRIGGEEHADREMEEIGEAVQWEEGSLAELLQPGVRIAVIIGVVLAILQQVSGINVIMYYGPEVFENTDIEHNVALLWQSLVGFVNMIFTMVAILTVDKLGRKPLLMGGAAGMAVCLTTVGMLFNYQQEGAWTLVFVLGYIACFAATVGPVVWVVLSEIFPNRIRGRAMGIATVCLWGANYVVSQTFPMLNENEWLVEKFNHGFPFWIYAGFCAIMVVFVGLALPETKERSLEEIESDWLLSDD
ncbi:MAG: sugar porter family MFS transporter, partial [Planctomycetota bacterium]